MGLIQRKDDASRGPDTGDRGAHPRPIGPRVGGRIRRVASAAPPPTALLVSTAPAMSDLLTPLVIRRQHDALRAVLRALVLLVRDAGRRGQVPDFQPLRALLFFAGDFPERLHHPKESALLWRRLAEAVPASAPLLERMRRGQAVAERGIRELGPLLSAWEMLGEPCRAPFTRALEACRNRFLAQMQAEEDEVLALAQRHFDASDWRGLDEAFGAADELAGRDRREDAYEAVLERILDAAPLAFDEVALPLGPDGLDARAELAPAA